MSCIANTFHGCFIVILHCFNEDLRGILTVGSYCFQLILAFLGCFIGVSRLFRVDSSVLYLLLKCVISCMVVSSIKGKLKDFFLGLLKMF